MGFSTITFIFIFFPVSILGNLCIEKLSKSTRIRNLYLVLVSLAFYLLGASPSDIKLILLLIISNYFLGYLLRNKKSRSIVAIGVILDVAVLVYYKYPQQIFSFFGNANQGLNVIMPLGISFIIFHCISYLIDLYSAVNTGKESDSMIINGSYSELDEFLNASLYVLFFPKLIQGPITQYTDFRQYLGLRKTNINNLTKGLERFIIGLSKKVLIADELNTILTDIGMSLNIDSGTAWLIVVTYGLRIFYDFAGYSDMAIGIAQMLGVSLPENFDKPYLSSSISEFWDRWHMSLGKWLRQYVYFPLGGNRHGNVFLNLFVVFLVSGLWHGNTKLYLLWGIAHGLVVVLERTKIYRKIDFSKTTAKIFGHFYTLLVVFFGWMCFYLPNVSSFLLLMKKLFWIPTENKVLNFTFWYYWDKKTIFILLIAILGVVLSSTRFFNKLKLQTNEKPIFYFGKIVILIVLFIFCFMGMNVNTYTPFIYFQY